MTVRVTLEALEADLDEAVEDRRDLIHPGDGKAADTKMHQERENGPKWSQADGGRHNPTAQTSRLRFAISE